MNELSITIITPNLNGGKYLEACINSIQNQNYPNLIHVVIDGGSTDNSIDILEKTQTSYEIVKGLNNYEAIHYGFHKYPSDIQAWLNADDLYREGAIHSVMYVFKQFKHISWLTGTPSFSNQDGIIQVSEAHAYPLISKYTWTISSKIYIQQESTFWRQSLYKKVGGLSIDYKYASDYHLWFRFFKLEYLYALPQILASFRIHSNEQISVSNKIRYESEVLSIIQLDNRSTLFKIWTRIWMVSDYFIIRIPVIRRLYAKFGFRQKYLGFASRLLFYKSGNIIQE